jgi:hypothetical protein
LCRVVGFRLGVRRAMPLALTQPGDTVAILLGCQVPVVVRQHADHYEFVGICYVHGIIQGEAWWDWRLGSARFNSLILDDAPVVARLMA